MEIEFPSGFCYLILYFFKCQNVIKHITSIYLMNLDIFLEWNRVKTKSNILPIVFFELTNLSAICRFCYREKKKTCYQKFEMNHSNHNTRHSGLKKNRGSKPNYKAGFWL